MASDSRKIRSLVAFIFLVGATKQVNALSCPPPADIETLIVTHDTANLAWNSPELQGNALYCVCMSAGNIGKMCELENTPPECQRNVTGQVTVKSNLTADMSYTMCVQTQCSGFRFSSPVCKTFRTSIKDRSAQYQAVDAKRSSSSLDISWRLPRPPKGRLAGYRLRWCQSSKCVTKELSSPGTNDETLSPKELQPYRQYTLYASAFSVDTSSGQKLYGDETSLIVYTLESYGEKESIHLDIKAENSSTLLVSWPELSGDSTTLRDRIVTWWKANQVGRQPTIMQNMTIPASSTRVFIHGLEVSSTYHIVLSEDLKDGGTKRPYTKVNADFYRKPDVHAEVRSFSSDSALFVTWDVPLLTDKDASPQLYAVRACPTCVDKGETTPAECDSIAVPARAGKAVFNGLKDACEYKVEVRALVNMPDGRTELGEPAVVFVTTLTPLRQDEPDPYQKPEGLLTSVKRIMNTSVLTVTWKALQYWDENDSPVRGYAVTLCPTCDQTESVETGCSRTEVAASVAKAVFPGLIDLCEYQVEVRALVEDVSGGIDEGEPAVTNVTTPPPSLPPLKSSLHAELDGNRVTVYWKRPVKGLDDYKVFYHVRLLGPHSKSVIEATVNRTEETFTNLQPRGNYSLEVSLCVARGKRQHCAPCAMLEFQTWPTGTVGDLNVTATGPSELHVSWSSPNQEDDITLYHVSWWRDEPEEARDDNRRNYTFPFNETSVTIDGLEAYTSYKVQVVPVYERKNVSWLGSPTHASATTNPEGPPQVTDISVTMTNRTQFSSDALISWKTAKAAAKSLSHTEYYVMICVDVDDLPENCRNQTVLGKHSTAAFSRVKNYAAIFVTIQPILKAEGKLIEGNVTTARALTWTPAIPRVRDIVVQDVTASSARISWSEVKELVGIDGAYYGVVISTHRKNNRESNVSIEQVVARNTTSSRQEQALVPTEAPTADGQLILFNKTTNLAEMELHDLKPWTNYTIFVYPAVSGSGGVVVGDMSSEVLETLAEAPGKPRNVSVEERQGGHYLTWLPPESWNGPRSGYEVSITCMNGNVRANSTSVAIDADKVELRIPRLSPGVPCSVSIYAYTVYQGEPMDGDKVRVRFTPPQNEHAIARERPVTL